MRPEQSIWTWRDRNIGWSFQGPAEIHSEEDASDTRPTQAGLAVLLIHGFGANTNHWRFNQPVLAEHAPTYAIDLIGFGRKSILKSKNIYTKMIPIKQ